ncbi:MAG: Holliday junction DNA helicase RuvA [Sphingobacteriales bacterium]|jgi:Holliday junction DNA helicase RuvA
MIAYINGDLVLKTPTHVILDVNGIGYDIHISLTTFSHIPDSGKCKLHTYLHIKEDAHTLYGFSSEQEKALFSALISVSGVGPSTGRMILSSMEPQDIRHAIITENVGVIKSIKGIGPKSAQRLILELKDKLIKESDEDKINILTGGNTAKSEALSALQSLGFTRNVAEKAIQKGEKDKGTGIPVEELIKYALQNM